MGDLKLYVVRHGETEWNREEVFRGRKDIPLNGTGRLQAQKTGEYLKRFRIQAIYTSPLQRARETASFISESTGAPVIVAEEFNDMDFGIWEGLSLGEVMTNFPGEFEKWRKTPHLWRVERSESLKVVRRRVSMGLNRILSEKEGMEEIAIVTHRVICKILSLVMLKIPNRYFWSIKVDPASISIFEYSEGDFVATLINQTSHLEIAYATYRDF